MGMRQISSKDNPSFRHWRSLAEDGRYRREQGRAMLDGIHLVHAALQTGSSLAALLCSESGLNHAEIAALQQQAQGEGVACYVLRDALFKSLSQVDVACGVMAEMAVPVVSAPAVDLPVDALLIAGVQDAGNLGSLLRTAAAAGIRYAYLSDSSAQAWSPKVLRAGMGAHFVLSIFERVNLATWLASTQNQVVAADLGEGCVSLFAADLRPATAWLVGAEGQGVPCNLLTHASVRVSIPMPGAVESLNVGAAAAVCLFEQLRQRSAR